MAENHPFCGEARVIIRGIHANVLDHGFETENVLDVTSAELQEPVAGGFSKRRAPTEIDWLRSADAYYLPACQKLLHSARAFFCVLISPSTTIDLVLGKSW